MSSYLLPELELVADTDRFAIINRTPHTPRSASFTGRRRYYQIQGCLFIASCGYRAEDVELRELESRNTTNEC